MNKNIDIKNIKVAKRYALALSESASDCIDEVNNDLNLINEVVFDNNDFKTFFLHPIVALKDKKETIQETFEGKINPKTLNFIETLLDENRLNIFKTIFELFKDEIDKIKNKQRVEVVSAIELEEEEKNKLQAKLKEKLNKDVILSYQEDKSILGGLIIKLDDKIVDLSLRTKFNILKQNI